MFSGHPELEMALVELYRTTGDKGRLELAEIFFTAMIASSFRRARTCITSAEFRSPRGRTSKGTRGAMYACCGATDYYMETGDPAYWKTLNELWENLVSAQMYVTGGVGGAGRKSFRRKYELPNFTAYGESCAAIGNMMWNWRMLAATGDAKFADVIERALYNGINSGMSQNGTSIATAIRWRLTLRAAIRSAIRGTTRRAARRIWSAPSHRCRDIFTARAKMDWICICTTIRSSTGILRTGQG